MISALLSSSLGGEGGGGGESGADDDADSIDYFACRYLLNGLRLLRCASCN